jgi:hypothetical protein
MSLSSHWQDFASWLGVLCKNDDPGMAESLEIRAGGQTGVDRAALDAAMELGIPCGGWCPRGRKAEDGVIPARYSLRETPTGAYAERTEWNVRDAEVTIILHRGPVRGGTRLTIRKCREYGRPHLLVDLSAPMPVRNGIAWLREVQAHVINIAGPRESQAPGIYREAKAYLQRLLKRMRSG